MNQRLERIKDQNVAKYGCKDTKKIKMWQSMDAKIQKKPQLSKDN
nr:hypothetical protein [uncultured Prevotella sp.]